MFIVKLLLDVIFTSAYQQNCQENLQLSSFWVSSFDLRIHWYKVFIGADQVLWCLFWGSFSTSMDVHFSCFGHVRDGDRLAF